MNSYVVDISNPCKKKETSKTVENLLEEYEKISNEIEIYGTSVGAILFLSVVATICGFSFDVNLIIFLIVMFFLFFMLIKFDKTERRKIKELKEIKIKLLTSLKQEKFILEHNREYTLFPRENLLYYARENRAVYVNGEGNFYAQEILLKYPDIQKIVEIETTYEFLKIHSKYQEIINKLCKEKTSKKTIYRT